MDVTSTPAAPAPPAAPDTISATRTAANAGSFADFDKADRAAKAGTPLPDVPAPAASPAAGVVADPAAAAPLSRKERDQQETNDRIRKAVESATADLRSELALFREGTARRDPPPAAAAPVADTPEWKRVAALPGAPKLAEFDSVEEHSAAMATFVAREILKTDQAAAQSRADAERSQTYFRDQVSAFDTRVTELTKTDPEILAKIVPVAKELGTLAMKGGPARTLSDMVLESDVGPQILNHFREHPDALTSLLTPPAATRGLPVDAAVRVHIRHFAREFAKLEATFASSVPAAAAPVAPAAPSTISAAPPPPPTLSRAGTTVDPKASAIARGDFATADKLWMQEKRSRLGHA